MSDSSSDQEILKSIPKEVTRLIVKAILGVDTETIASEIAGDNDSAKVKLSSWVETFGIEQKSQYSGNLTLEEIAEGIYAANQNALRLLADAELLFSSERYPSAIALAILSIEELGKHLVLNGLVTLTPGNKTSPIWKEFRSHTKKNILWILPALVKRDGKSLSNIFLQLIVEDSKHPEELDWLKQFCTYTDCVGNRCWQQPSSAGTELASNIIDVAKGLSVRASQSEKEILNGLKQLHQVFSEGSPQEQIKKAMEYLKEIRGNLPP